ncbi:hypothetical protein F4821DRAFT_270351 [Hypoxylon rubiginosum]|uniref:Uncharacterized protein n=1 Tax=Hypoxylon rubiginosum TaxID=110542 RepID=A0ACC0CZW1_9PEZI|nr:hypothetical protein F4821DRAFT_270351 [Hypoxylon rubiginosum]
MDHARCAALHNYLVDYRLAAEGLNLAANRDTFMSRHGAATSAILPRLHPSLAAFLAAARIIRFPFLFAHGFPNPGVSNDLVGLIDNGLADLYSEPEDCLVRLYLPVIESGGESGGGLIYHQTRHVATFSMNADDADYALPVDEHPMNWHPLETVLSNWISLIRLGKVVASPAPRGLFGSEKIGPWEWRPYGNGQVAACVAAWDRLCGAIEARQDAAATPAGMVDDGYHHPGEPLLTPVALNAANIPDPSFAREFLNRARRPPRIHRIAPGLSLPPADEPSFAAAQPYAHLLPPGDATQQDEGVLMPPVYLFFSGAYDAPVDVAGWRSPFRGCLAVDDAEAARVLPARVPAGLYTEGVARGRDLECAEEGFRLLLPFAVAGARRSDGSEVDDDVAGGLFQHGYKPFGGNYHRPQRLERLLDHWAGLVRRGVWAVGPRGVEGGLEVFRNATGGGMDYIIPPSW